MTRPRGECDTAVGIVRFQMLYPAIQQIWRKIASRVCCIILNLSHDKRKKNRHTTRLERYQQEDGYSFLIPCICFDALGNLVVCLYWYFECQPSIRCNPSLDERRSPRIFSRSQGNCIRLYWVPEWVCYGKDTFIISLFLQAKDADATSQKVFSDFFFRLSIRLHTVITGRRQVVRCCEGTLRNTNYSKGNNSNIILLKSFRKQNSLFVANSHFESVNEGCYGQNQQ